VITVNNKNIEFSYDDAVNIANKVAIEKLIILQINKKMQKLF